jgi:hypothetical protein
MTIIEMLRACGDGISNEAASELQNAVYLIDQLDALAVGTYPSLYEACQRWKARVNGRGMDAQRTNDRGANFGIVAAAEEKDAEA